jgi:nitroreductase
VLRETQTSPSSFNLQPVKGIVVQGKAQKEALSKCMIGNNSHRVLTAPLSLVILADMYGGRNVKPLMELERRHGGFEGYISSIPALVSFTQGSGILSGAIKRVATHIFSPVQPMPVIESREAWSYKNAGIFAQMFMISAAANGLGSTIMYHIMKSLL